MVGKQSKWTAKAHLEWHELGREENAATYILLKLLHFMWRFMLRSSVKSHSESLRFRGREPLNAIDARVA